LNDRAGAERGGRRAELLAAWWLRLKGYSIIGQRVRCPRGEIDIIARRGRTLAFVEVKQRRNADAAAMAINPHSLRRVVAAAAALAPRYMRAGDIIRIDAVLIAKRCLPRHLMNIWHG